MINYVIRGGEEGSEKSPPGGEQSDHPGPRAHSVWLVVDRWAGAQRQPLVLAHWKQPPYDTGFTLAPGTYSVAEQSIPMEIGLLPAQAAVEVSFQVQISQNASGQIINQAWASYIDPAAPGELLTVYSDNPDTGEAQDPTVILIRAPTSLHKDDEPATVQRSIFLPTVMR